MRRELVASLAPGTCRGRLWLLPSGPDQVHQTAMRGGPPASIVSHRSEESGARQFAVSLRNDRHVNVRSEASSSIALARWLTRPPPKAAGVFFYTRRDEDQRPALPLAVRGVRPDLRRRRAHRVHGRRFDPR